MNIRQVLDETEINQYKQAGYTEQDIQTALNEINTGNQTSSLQQSYQQTMRTDPRQLSTTSQFSTRFDENLIKWQLEVDSILERVEHMLRGDKITFKDGSLIWIETEEEKEKIFNNYGVSEIMRILSLYINRNTILSNYDEYTINMKMLDLGYELADLIYLKYEDFGLDTLQKRKLYPMIVRQIVDAVHSAYLRALHGGERQSLKESRTVTQTEPLGHGININTGQPMKERGILNPLRLLGGKYK